MTDESNLQIINCTSPAINQDVDDDDKLLENFKPDLRPPNIKLAQLHALAKRVGEPKINTQDNKQLKICPCCGFQIEKELIEVCTSNDQLGFIGCGIPMFFSFMKYCIFFLTLMIIIQGIYGILKNKNGDICNSYWLMHQQSCSYNIANIYSSENRKNKDIDNLYSGLNLLTMVVLILSSIAFRANQNNLERSIDDDNLTPSDYSIMITNMPINEKEDDIIQYFKDLYKGQVDVQKVVFSYNINHLIQLKSNKAKWQTKEEKLILLQKKGQELTDKIKVVRQAIENIENQIQEYEKICQDQGFKQSGVVFVSFNTEQQVDLVLNDFNQYEFLNSICFNLFGSSKMYKGQSIIVTRAPEPSDIMWQNLGISNCERLWKRIITFIFSSILVGICFLFLYLLSSVQENLKQSSLNSHDDNSTGQQFLSIIASLCIVFINQGLAQLIRGLSIQEKHDTITGFYVSLAIKLGYAQFFNTVILTFVVNQIYNSDKYMTQGGLISDVYFIFLISAYLPLFLSYFNPWYAIKLWKQRKIIKDGQQSILTQQQANLVFEGPIFDPAIQYASIVKTVLLSCFYVYLIPGSLIISITGLFIQYWLTKYLLLRRYSCPQQIGSQLSKVMIKQFIEFAILLFAIGCIVFEKNIFKTTSVYTILQLIISIIYFIVPNSIINKCCCFKEKQFQTVFTYQQVHLNFFADYDRSNPITMFKAMQQWIEDIEKHNLSNQGKKTFFHQETKKELFNYLNKQQTKKFEGINNYANNNYQSYQIHQQQQFNPLSHLGRNPILNLMGKNLFSNNAYFQNNQKKNYQINQILPFNGEKQKESFKNVQSQIYQPVQQTASQRNDSNNSSIDQFKQTFVNYQNILQEENLDQKNNGAINKHTNYQQRQFSNNQHAQVYYNNEPSQQQQQQFLYNNQQQQKQQQLPYQQQNFQQLPYQQQQQPQFQYPNNIQLLNNNQVNLFNNNLNPGNVIPMTLNQASINK